MPDINYGKILETLNDKVDLSGSWSTPSSQYDNITIGATTAQYTAPADGYFVGFMSPSSTSYYWQQLTNETNGMKAGSFMYSMGYAFSVIMPVKVGDVINYNYRLDSTYNTWWLRFYYAQKTN